MFEKMEFPIHPLTEFGQNLAEDMTKDPVLINLVKSIGVKDVKRYASDISGQLFRLILNKAQDESRRDPVITVDKPMFMEAIIYAGEIQKTLHEMC